MRQILICLFLACLVASLEGASLTDKRGRQRSRPSPVKLAAAQICKPYFLSCKTKPNANVSRCFTDFSKCFKELFARLTDMEACVKQGGYDSEAMSECILTAKYY